MNSSDDMFKIASLTFLGSILMILTQNDFQTIYNMSFIGTVLLIAYFGFLAFSKPDSKPISKETKFFKSILEFLIVCWIIGLLYLLITLENAPISLVEALVSLIIIIVVIGIVLVIGIFVSAIGTKEQN